jgi:hypothetical protein
MQFNSDIDLDFGDRDLALSHLRHIPASQHRDGRLGYHASGIYVTDIPRDPLTGLAAIEYKQAEARGYVKLDFLNVNLYQQVRDQQHLSALLELEPDWAMLLDPKFCGQLSHIGNHYDTLISMPESVNSIPRLAMFLAVIRPAKRNLIGKPWATVAKTIWDRPTDDSYFWKKSHAVAYSHLVVVHMNLLVEQVVLTHAPD